MATKYFCDRCSQQSDSQDFITRMHVAIPEYTGRIYHLITINTDICASCYKDLQEWVKPLPQCKEG